MKEKTFKIIQSIIIVTGLMGLFLSMTLENVPIKEVIIPLTTSLTIIFIILETILIKGTEHIEPISFGEFMVLNGVVFILAIGNSLIITTIIYYIKAIINNLMEIIMALLIIATGIAAIGGIIGLKLLIYNKLVKPRIPKKKKKKQTYY